MICLKNILVTKMIKKLLFLLIIPFIIAFSSGNYIWNEGHHKRLGRIDVRGIIYDYSINEKEIGRIQNEIIYNDPYGGIPIGRIESNNIYNNERVIGRWENGKVYDKGYYGGQIVGLCKNPKASAYFLLKGEL